MSQPMSDLPDLSLDSNADLAAEFLSGFAINRNLLDVSASEIKQEVYLITKRAHEDHALDIGQSNIPTSIPPGCSAQSDEQPILREYISS